VVPQAAAIADLGSKLSYELGEFSNGRRYQLNLTVKLALDED